MSSVHILHIFEQAPTKINTICFICVLYYRYLLTWLALVPIGRDSLQNNLKNMYEEADIDGNITKHSLSKKEQGTIHWMLLGCMSIQMYINIKVFFLLLTHLAVHLTILLSEKTINISCIKLYVPKLARLYCQRNSGYSHTT